MAQDIRDTVILGTGCAGLTAAIYAARANLKPLVLEGHEPGGQLSITTLVENFPGWPEGIQGPDLIEKMKLQATRFGADIQMGHLHSVDFSKRPLTLFVGKETVHTRTLIIASGASARWLGLPSEQALIGHGVSSCATCDGFFFSGKEIAVIGGGDSAMEEALFLTRFATKVSVIHRREQFRSSKIMLERAMAHDKIKFLTNTAVEEVLGVEKKEVTGLRLRNTATAGRVGAAGERHVPGDWAYSECGDVQGADRSGRGWLHQDHGPGVHQGAWSLRLRRCAGPAVPAGDYGGRVGMHGGARGGEIS